MKLLTVLFEYLKETIQEPQSHNTVILRNKTARKYESIMLRLDAKGDSTGTVPEVSGWKVPRLSRLLLLSCVQGNIYHV